MIEKVKTYSVYSLLFNKYRKITLPLIKFLIASGLIIYIVTSISIREILISFTQANKFILILVSLMGLVNLLIQYYKWKLTSQVILETNDNLKIIRSLFKGFTAAVFTPARIGEYFGRALEFKDKPLIKVTLATLIDKAYPLIIVSFLGSIASIIFIHYYYKVNNYLTIGLFITLFALFYFVLMILFSKDFWNNFLFRKLSSVKRLNKYLKKIEVVKNLDKNYSVKMILLSILFYLCYIMQFALLVMAFSNHYNFIDYFWAGNLVMFSKTFFPPISLGELGIREGASVYFIGFFGENASVGFNASIFLFIINILLPAIFGLTLLLRKEND